MESKPENNNAHNSVNRARLEDHQIDQLWKTKKNFKKLRIKYRPVCVDSRYLGFETDPKSLKEPTKCRNPSPKQSPSINLLFRKNINTTIEKENPTKPIKKMTVNGTSIRPLTAATWRGESLPWTVFRASKFGSLSAIASTASSSPFWTALNSSFSSYTPQLSPCPIFGVSFTRHPPRRKKRGVVVVVVMKGKKWWEWGGRSN